MKKMIVAGLMAVALVSLSVPTLAHPPIQVYVDGQAIAFDQPPVILEDRTLVPMRGIFQALGSEVTWSEPTQTITSTRGGDTIVLKIGDTGLYKNGTLAYTMTVPAKIINDRTMVPIRAISEAFGAEVSWDGVGYVITILSSTQETSQDYAKTVKAEDGTTVLTAKMDVVKSSGPFADAILKSLGEEAFKLGEGFVREYGEKAKSDYETAKKAGKSFDPYYCVGSYAITRDDENFVSFFGDTTQYTGGAQDERDAVSKTYSAKTGKELSLDKIIQDSPDELNYFWNVSFRALINAKPESFYKDADVKIDGYLDDVDFYLTKEGIGFYLPPRTIAPNEMGIISFTVEYQLP